MFSLHVRDYHICEGLVRPGIDYVYSNSKLGDQRTIAQMLNENIQDTMSLLTDHDQNCVKQVFRVHCHYYLPSCGSSTHTILPSSICQEECLMVQETCQRTWNTVFLAFKTIDPTIMCRYLETPLPTTSLLH